MCLFHSTKCAVNSLTKSYKKEWSNRVSLFYSLANGIRNVCFQILPCLNWTKAESLKSWPGTRNILSSFLCLHNMLACVGNFDTKREQSWGATPNKRKENTQTEKENLLTRFILQKKQEDSYNMFFLHVLFMLLNTPFKRWMHFSVGTNNDGGNKKRYIVTKMHCSLAAPHSSRVTV